MKYPKKEDEFDWLACLAPEMKGAGTKEDIVIGEITGKLPMSRYYHDNYGRVYEVVYQMNEPPLWLYVFSILIIEE